VGYVADVLQRRLAKPAATFRRPPMTSAVFLVSGLYSQNRCLAIGDGNAGGPLLGKADNLRFPLGNHKDPPFGL
jgi:hypothetical protein